MAKRVYRLLSILVLIIVFYGSITAMADSTSSTQESTLAASKEDFTVGNVQWHKISDLYDISLHEDVLFNFSTYSHSTNLLNGSLVGDKGYYHNEVYLLKRNGEAYIETPVYDFDKIYPLKDVPQYGYTAARYYGNEVFNIGSKSLLCKAYIYYNPLKTEYISAKYLDRFILIDKDGKITESAFKIKIPVQKGNAYSILDIYYSNNKYTMIIGVHGPDMTGTFTGLAPESFIKYTSTDLVNWTQIDQMKYDYFGKIFYESSKKELMALKLKYKYLTNDIDTKIRSYLPMKFKGKVDNGYDIQWSGQGDTYAYTFRIKEIKNGKVTYVLLDYNIAKELIELKTPFGKGYTLSEDKADNYNIPIIVRIEAGNKYTLVTPADLKEVCSRINDIVKSREEFKNSVYPYLIKLNDHYTGKKLLTDAVLNDAKQYVISQNDSFVMKNKDFRNTLYIKRGLWDFVNSVASKGYSSLEIKYFIMPNNDLVIHGYDNAYIVSAITKESDWSSLARNGVKFKGYIGSSLNHADSGDQNCFDLGGGGYFNLVHSNGKTAYALSPSADTLSTQATPVDQVQSTNLRNFFYYNGNVYAYSDGMWVEETLTK